jgi:hypothetical protein
LLDDMNTPRAIAALHQMDELNAPPTLPRWGFAGDLTDPRAGRSMTQKSKPPSPCVSKPSRTKDFAEADRIRDELTAQGIQLRNSKTERLQTSCNRRTPDKLGTETMSTPERLYLYCTTRRCATGRRRLVLIFRWKTSWRSSGMLDELGLDYIEGGYPGANQTDTALFAEPREMKASFAAFGMTRRAGRSAANDPGLQDLVQAKSMLCALSPSPGTIMSRRAEDQQ